MGAVALCSMLAVTAVQAAPTDGYVQYNNTYTVQNRTSGCGGFADLGGGEFETWVCSGEERCEMRWADWPNQNQYNQFEMDAMFSSDTQSTAIHQIKSNTGGEPIYLQVNEPGTLRNDNGSDFASGMANTWFHVNSLFNPANGDGKLYINGSLKVTRSYPTSDRSWYFKNGTYNNGLPSGHKSTAWFKNIKSWIKSSVVGTTVSFEAENLAVSNSGVGTSVQTDANSSNGEWISLNATGTGSWMEFTTGTVQAGAYSVSMMWKGNNNRGITDFFVDGNQVGGTLDQYSSAQSYPTTTFGSVTFGSSGTHKIRMHVVGKNSSSSSYVLSADKFTFTAQ